MLSERSLRRTAPRRPVLFPQWPMRLLPWLQRALTMLAGLALFVLALHLLKQGAGEYGSAIIEGLHMSHSANALGFGWLLSYAFLSGSPVASIAVSLFATGTIDDVQTFVMITGSRLGASFIVLLAGWLYHLRGHPQQASISAGMLALLTTLAIYLPALIPGSWLLTSGVLDSWHPAILATTESQSWLDQVSTPLLHILDAWLPGWALLGCGLLLLLAAFSVIDRALPSLGSRRGVVARLERVMVYPLAMFLLGAAFTSVTLSVSVSLTLLVPLAARGIMQPRHMLPYIMGANVATFIDTLLAALVVGGSAAFIIVFIEMASVLLLSLGILVLCYRHFEWLILGLQEWILQRHDRQMLFLAIMALMPVLLLLC